MLEKNIVEKSLEVPLAHHNMQGMVYAISIDRFFPMYFNGQTFTSFEDKPLPKPMPQFIDDCLREKTCIGVTALHPYVVSEIDNNRRLKPILVGDIVRHWDVPGLVGYDTAERATLYDSND